MQCFEGLPDPKPTLPYYTVFSLDKSELSPLKCFASGLPDPNPTLPYYTVFSLDKSELSPLKCLQVKFVKREEEISKGKKYVAHVGIHFLSRKRRSACRETADPTNEDFDRTSEHYLFGKQKLAEREEKINKNIYIYLSQVERHCLCRKIWSGCRETADPTIEDVDGTSEHYLFLRNRILAYRFGVVNRFVMDCYKHRWFSGRMLACHADGPGSIPGRCMRFFTF
ncbi:hypothetical protein CEXT_462271 [Caerostris extrusa]|uniref:Uncharacterized protein n=1 Tax=Caerostris extrusa TaxID=172846 RepID=A0AAV4RXJ9_CAEEX|nr:hypothetical protein CEXT_462271 [Caerostris extrusa]